MTDCGRAGHAGHEDWPEGDTGRRPRTCPNHRASTPASYFRAPDSSSMICCNARDLLSRWPYARSREFIEHRRRRKDGSDRWPLPWWQWRGRGFALGHSSRGVDRGRFAHRFRSRRVRLSRGAKSLRRREGSTRYSPTCRRESVRPAIPVHRGGGGTVRLVGRIPGLWIVLGENFRWA